MFISGEQYAHTLIADRVDFVPEPERVATFFDGLVKLGSAPLRPELFVMTRTGEFLTGVNPATGETISIPRSKRTDLQDCADIPQALRDLKRYDVIMSGEGPPPLPPFTLWTNDRERSAGPETSEESDYAIVGFDGESYGFDVSCCVRPEIVSTSYWEDKESPYQPPFFDHPATLNDRTGYFVHPIAGEVVTVANAGCARFWIEFVFGKWCFPKIKDNFDVLEPTIVSYAEQHFGSKFVQACHWI